MEEFQSPRAPAARKEGIRAAAAFPVLVDGEARGVMEFFSRHVRERDQDLLDLLEAIGNQIGQFLGRKASETAVRQSEARKASIPSRRRRVITLTTKAGSAS